MKKQLTVSTGACVPGIGRCADQPVTYHAGSSHAIRQDKIKAAITGQAFEPAGECNFEAPVVANCTSGVDGVLVQQDPTDKPTTFSRDEFAERNVPSGPAVATPNGEPQRSG